jgi:glycosyltransferase involved in cell wall biosynthesis
VLEKAGFQGILAAMTDWPRHCAAVISCFNEAERIPPVVMGMRRHLPQVIIVDDGSTDDTAEIAKNCGATVVRLPKNGGKGAALRTGWRRAGELGFAWVLMLDGDGQHAPEDAPKFLDCANRTGARLVIGNRMVRAEAMPWVRRQVNAWMSRRISALTGAALPDSQCGFRLAHLETLRGLPLITSHFEIESEVLAAFLAAGQRVEFVPVQTIYHAGPSRIRPIPDAWRWWRWLRAQQKARARPGRASAPLWTRHQSNPVS